MSLYENWMEFEWDLNGIWTLMYVQVVTTMHSHQPPLAPPPDLNLQVRGRGLWWQVVICHHQPRPVTGLPRAGVGLVVANDSATMVFSISDIVFPFYHLYIWCILRIVVSQLELGKWILHWLCNLVSCNWHLLRNLCEGLGIKYIMKLIISQCKNVFSIYIF